MPVEVTPPDTPTGREAVENIRLRNVSGMSFAFVAKVDRWERDSNGKLLRRVVEAQLIEVSPVAFPAYEVTSVKAELPRARADTQRELELLKLATEEAATTVR